MASEPDVQALHRLRRRTTTLGSPWTGRRAGDRWQEAGERRTSRRSCSRTRRLASRTRCSARPNLPGDIYLSAQMPADAQAKLVKVGPSAGGARAGDAAHAPPATEDPRRGQRRQRACSGRLAVAERPTLSLRGITKHYDAIAALTDVSFDVLPGEVHALLGENGAGKSTLMNVASGLDGTRRRHDRASTAMPVEHLTPAIAQELGIAIVHQHPALLPDMTVAENIRVAVASEHLRRRDPDRHAARCARCSTTSTSPGHLEDRRLVSQRRPAPPARARQGVRGRRPTAADPRRADGAALAGLGRPALHRRPRARCEQGPRSSTSRTDWPRSARSPTG